jgi:Arc/MetJ-type ribon-helix-helix transcriptional regulator
MGENIVLSTRVPKVLADKIKAKAETEGYMNLSDFIRDLLRKA